MPIAVSDEFLLCLLLLPLMVSDLRVQLSSLVSATDASPDGGGACVAQQVTDSGVRHLHQLDATVHEEDPGFLLAALADGLAAARQA
eukprot:6140260-Amphidinium_carterae.1